DVIIHGDTVLASAPRHRGVRSAPVVTDRNRSPLDDEVAQRGRAAGQELPRRTVAIELGLRRGMLAGVPVPLADALEHPGPQAGLGLVVKESRGNRVFNEPRFIDR